MRAFLDDNFLLQCDTAGQLYHDYARDMPIIDYHNHLPPQEMAEDVQFDNLTQAWLYGDHYKWRAMRTQGVAEAYCTGGASDYDKFAQWAATVPYTLRNPLYHWTHLELRRYFGVDKILNPDTARDIYEHCSALLRTPEYSAMGLLRRMNVRVLCTTDDPIDDLAYHRQLRESGAVPAVLPAFRPDKAMACENPAAFKAYLALLEQASGQAIGTFDAFLEALRQRHDFFATQGCRVSDHGLEQLYAAPFTDAGLRQSFGQLLAGKPIDGAAQLAFKSAMLYHFAVWDWEKGWTQQFHLGALRNNNTRMRQHLGPDTGWDSIGDFPQAQAMSAFFDRLDSEDKLAKTIIYNLNPADNALMATMIGNFNDGSVAGKIQWGSAWWFLDQKDGMEQQLNALSNMGLLSRFVGMLTDSRSFLSFPRHEYFRRILCNLLGQEVERGELPNDIPWIGKVVQDICYYNADAYFKFK